DRFAEYIYGDCYNREAGIVKLEFPYQQRDEGMIIRDNYPMYQYFCKANPGWRDGDELVSLIDLRERNWKAIARRALHWNPVNA
ncbi:MAG: hypothetical protein AAF571_15530, partial [Verrucomicrobiota bacterium]